MPKRIATLLVVSLVAVAPSAAARRPSARTTVTVMTRNLYLGANLDPIVGAKSLQDAFLAVQSRWAQVEANDFSVRAHAIASEVAAAKPDFIGFQEAALYRTRTPADLTQPATDVAIDYIAELKKAFKQRGLRYRFVGVNPETDAAMPAGSPATMVIRLTLRDALAVRMTPSVKVVKVRLGHYAAKKQFFNGFVTAIRGWVSADVRVGTKKFRVITTHLESFDRSVSEAQSLELLHGPAATRLPVVLLGDLNSRPDGSTSASYANFIQGGFRDAWVQAYRGAAGLTCCHGEDLRDVGGPFSERIDYVLTRGGFRGLRGKVTGESPSTRVGGLWPSDHGGLWMTLRLPR